MKKEQNDQLMSAWGRCIFYKHTIKSQIKRRVNVIDTKTSQLSLYWPIYFCPD